METFQCKEDKFFFQKGKNSGLTQSVRRLQGKFGRKRFKIKVGKILRKNPKGEGLKKNNLRIIISVPKQY